MAHDDKYRKKSMDPPEYPPTWEDDWRPVAYFSQSINHPVPSDDDADNHRAEWWATECEALGLHNAIMHWAMYLRNGKPFSVVVDHQALLYLVKGQGRLTNRKILNMLMNLQEFRFSVIYRDGLRHLDADAISRLLHYQDNGETLMLEMNGSSLPVTPDIPIALMRKILLDYEFCRPGDNRNTDPTYYFHRPLASPSVSNPDTREDLPSTSVMTATVEDGLVEQEYASVPDHPGGLRPALTVSNAEQPVSIRYYKDDDKALYQVSTDMATGDQSLLVLTGPTSYEKFYARDKEQLRRDREERQQRRALPPAERPRLCEVHGCHSIRFSFDAIAEMYLCERHLADRCHESSLRIDTPTSHDVAPEPPQPTEQTGEQCVSTLAPAEAGGGGPRIEPQPPREVLTVESIRAFRRWKLARQRTEYQRLDPLIPQDVRNGAAISIE
jgi:hypothetical protein